MMVKFFYPVQHLLRLILVNLLVVVDDVEGVAVPRVDQKRVFQLFVRNILGHSGLTRCRVQHDEQDGDLKDQAT